MREFTGWSKDLRVTADGTGVVGMVGAMGLRMLADRTGLTGGLSRVLVKPGFNPVHDRGRVLTDVACSIAAGGVDLCDIEALRAKGEVFGPSRRTPPRYARWARSATSICTASTNSGRRLGRTCGACYPTGYWPRPTPVGSAWGPPLCCGWMARSPWPTPGNSRRKAPSRSRSGSTASAYGPTTAASSRR